MYELFPVIAGVIVAALVPRVVPSGRRRVAYGTSSVVVAGLATIIAGEEWFFFFVDFAAVVLAIAVTLTVAERLPGRRTSPPSRA